MLKHGITIIGFRTNLDSITNDTYINHWFLLTLIPNQHYNHLIITKNHGVTKNHRMDGLPDPQRLRDWRTHNAKPQRTRIARSSRSLAIVKIDKPNEDLCGFKYVWIVYRIYIVFSYSSVMDHWWIMD